MSLMACGKNLLHLLAVKVTLARSQQLKQSINRVVRVPYEGPSSQMILTVILVTRCRVFLSEELWLWYQGVVLRVRMLSKVPRLKVVTMEKGILTHFSLQRKCILSCTSLTW